MSNDLAAGLAAALADDPLPVSATKLIEVVFVDAAERNLDVGRLSDDELKQLADLVEKAKGDKPALGSKNEPSHIAMVIATARKLEKLGAENERLQREVDALRREAATASSTPASELASPSPVRHNIVPLSPSRSDSSPWAGLASANAGLTRSGVGQLSTPVSSDVGGFNYVKR